MNKSWTGLGIGNKNKKGEYLDMYFHPDNIYDSDKIIEKVKSHELVKVSDDTPPTNVPEAYLKLHLISLRLVKPNQTNLDGILEFFLMLLGLPRGLLTQMNFQKFFIKLN